MPWLLLRSWHETLRRSTYARPFPAAAVLTDHATYARDVFRTVPVKVALAIGVVLLVSYGYFYQGGGWNQNTRLDVIRAVTEHGTLRIDAYRRTRATALDSTVTCTPTKRPVSRCSRSRRSPSPRPLLDAHPYPTDSDSGTAFLAYVGTGCDCEPARHRPPRSRSTGSRSRSASA